MSIKAGEYDLLLHDKWETEVKRLLKFMKVPPKKKLEWLQQMHNFIVKVCSKRDKLMSWKLRGIR